MRLRRAPVGFLLFAILLSSSTPGSNADATSTTRSPKFRSSSGIGLPTLDTDLIRNQVVPTISNVEESVALRALNLAIKWTTEKRTADWGWGQDTPHTVLALALANSSYFTSNSLEAQLVMKQFELHLVLRLWKHKDAPMTVGHLALNVMALVSLCRDPRAFYSKDLVAVLDHREAGVDFELAFSCLASCNAGRHVRKARVRRLLDIITDQSKVHSVDTLSVVILALHCAQRQRKHNLKEYVEEALKVLLHQQNEDGSFESNLHTTAIALQAMMSSGLSESWNATRAQQYVLSHQLPDGSFGGIFDTNAVLPLLGGKTLLDVGEMSCQQDQSVDVDEMDGEVDSYEQQKQLPEVLTTTTPGQSSIEEMPENVSKLPEMINMTYIIWVGNNATIRYNQSFAVPKNTTFYTIMQMAAEEDHNFEFSASKWANGYYIHTLAGQREKQNGFWFWLLYRLRKPPIPGTKPSNRFVVADGVAELIPNDGDYILFWYHNI